MSAIRGDRGISVKRLTEKHVKKSDGHYMKCSEHCQNDTLQCGECDELDRFVDRLGSIEDILGDNYDLDRVKEAVRLIDKAIDLVQYTRDYLLKIPSADVAPVVHAQWGKYEAFPLAPSMNGYPCGNCGMHFSASSVPILKYCPNCGAKMEG